MIVHKVLAHSHLTKIDAKRREIGGRITDTSKDLDGEHCDVDASWPYYVAKRDKMAAISGGQNFLPLRDMHQLRAVGACIDMEKQANAIYGIFKVTDDAAWYNIEEGVLLGLSQGAKLVRRYLQDGEPWFVADPIECSLVDSPSCETCVLDYISRAGISEIRKFAKGVHMKQDHIAASHYDKLAAALEDAGTSTIKGAQLCKAYAEHLRGRASSDTAEPGAKAAGADDSDTIVFDVDRIVKALSVNPNPDVREEFRKSLIQK